MLATSNNTVFLQVKLAGGAPKRTRGESAGKNASEVIPVVYVMPTTMPNDIAVVAKALRVMSVDIITWLNTMTTERLHAFHNAYDAAIKASSLVDRHVNMMMERIQEFNELVVQLVRKCC